MNKFLGEDKHALSTCIVKMYQVLTLGIVVITTEKSPMTCEAYIPHLFVNLKQPYFHSFQKNRLPLSKTTLTMMLTTAVTKKAPKSNNAHACRCIMVLTTKVRAQS